MNRCLALLIAIVSTLFLALTPAMGAASAHQHRANVKVRHRAIHSPARKAAKCKRRRTHKAHKAHTRTKRARQCPTNKRSSRRKHKRAVTHTRHPRPATASRDCPNANLTPRPENIESVVAATLCLVNDERARFGEPALVEDTRLSRAASGHSHDMDARGYFEHVSPGGQTLLMRVRDSGFIPNGNVGYTLGENIAWGTLWLASPHAIVKAWMDSPGHRANILNRSYRYTGVGVDPDLPHSMSGGRPGGMYTQDFGTVLN